MLHLYFNGYLLLCYNSCCITVNTVHEQQWLVYCCQIPFYSTLRTADLILPSFFPNKNPFTCSALLCKNVRFLQRDNDFLVHILCFWKSFGYFQTVWYVYMPEGFRIGKILRLRSYVLQVIICFTVYMIFTRRKKLKANLFKKNYTYFNSFTLIIHFYIGCKILSATVYLGPDPICQPPLHM